MSQDVEIVWSELKTLLLADSALPGSIRGSLLLTEPRGIMAGTIYLEVPNDFQRSNLEHRARQPILDAIAQLDTDEEITNYAVVVNADLRSEPRPETEDFDEPEPHPSALEQAAAVIDQGEEPEALEFTTRPSGGASTDSRLNPRYTFDNFIIGGSNRFAHAAAVAVAEAPARSYNPLFIYGDSGLGKTHLLHAIGNYAENIYPGIKVRYVSSEEFTNDFINSIAANAAAQFQSRYRNNDILLIDDIQFLQGKDSTVEAFFHTFNTLHEHNKQVVITSDVPPKLLTGFEARMRSRFEWGLITDVQSPDLETRIAILRKKAEADNIEMPDDSLQFIAVHVTSSVRELEGTLIRVAAYASLNDRDTIDLDLVMHALKDIIPDDEPKVIAPEDIVAATADYFNCTINDLYGSSRSAAIAQSRQISMYLCRELTNLSLPKIGQLFGGRDHTTVMYSYRKIVQRLVEDRDIYNQVTELTARIRQPQRH